MASLDRKFCVAPMMTHTDRHFRYFLRLLSRRAMLYTEMLTTGALIHGDHSHFLEFNEAEHPVGLQLGGSDPGEMQTCARMAEDFAYDEVNINVGCPSDRVQSGRFGACLMAEPGLVAECVHSMRSAVKIPVTVKTRIGIDDMDSYEELVNLVRLLRDAGCETIVIHARKAWLSGLSPRQNREIPPLKYDVVHSIKSDFPELEIIINGGILTLDECEQQLEAVDGVMLGRAVCHDPYLLAQVDNRIYGESSAPPSRATVLDQYMDYMRAQLDRDIYLKHMSRHILGIFRGHKGARAFRRHLSEESCKPGAGIEVIEQALELVDAA